MAWTTPKTNWAATDGVAAADMNRIEGNISDLNSSKASTTHTHAASNVTAGTLAGQVVANATAVATIGTAQVRNIYAGTTDLTAGTSALATGTIYIVYE